MTPLVTLTPGAYGHSILQDVALICVLAAVMAGIIHSWLRSAIPSLQWNQIGKVDTSLFGPLDILGCILVTLPFTVTLAMPHVDPSMTELSPLSMLINFGILIMMAAIVLGLFTARDRYPDGLGLQPKHPAQVIAWAAAAYILIYIISIILGQAGLEQWLSERLGEKQNQHIVNEMLNTQSGEKLLIIILGACVIAPVAEEIIFRGYLYPVIKRFSEPTIAAITSGILFGAIHGQIWALIPLSIFGILLAILYEKSGSIWAPILCHAMFNSINIFFMLTMGDQL
ncbi:CPBP family intramembrane glutamic endopeptidase [Rubritalea tangerina]|uniref:CPBP family intramembrane glutamic endopeptidase n=2 Tax=Rubritalea tangerina TaxID=430798 RepID=A0ABW4ZCT8_9BACT